MTNLQEDISKPGIWQFWQYFPKIEKKYWLNLGEGRTKALLLENIIFKREDLNPTGSIKDRGLVYQISQAYSKGLKDLVISSSGNAAISAGAYCRQAGINLYVFISEKILSPKLEKVKSYDGQIKISKRPLSDSIKFAKEKGFKNLRPSIDPLGTEGYKTIAFEIFQEFGKIDDIFLPVSSATCLVGVSQGFEVLGFKPRFHACQSTKVNTIAAEFDKNYIKTKTSLAGALVAKVTPRKDQAIKIINESKGWGWVIGDSEIHKAMKWLEDKGIETSAEGALALSGIWKAKKEGWQLGKTVCLLTGMKYQL